MSSESNGGAGLLDVVVRAAAETAPSVALLMEEAGLTWTPESVAERIISTLTRDRVEGERLRPRVVELVTRELAPREPER